MFKNFFTHLIEIIEGIFREGWIYIALLLAGTGVGVIVITSSDFAGDLPNIIKDFLTGTSWLWVFIILFSLFKGLWLHWRQELFKNDLKWKVLEIRIPREVQKNPQAMEQILTAIHTLRNAPSDVIEKYWDGEVTCWFSLELVSFDGEVHFYIRIPAKYKDLIESAFFSYYRDVEIEEIDDYISRLPINLKELYAQDKDIWGAEMVLAKEDAYPIKTYHQFEAIEEERQYDPIASFLEILGKVKKGEFIGIQILIAPLGEDWKEKWQPLVNKLKTQSAADSLRAALGEGETMTKMAPRSPGETDVLKAVENNLSKRAFSTLIRFVYFSPKSIYYDSFARHGIAGAFNQYSALNINSFRQNSQMGTRTRIWNWPYIFPKTRREFRKQRLIYNYRHREVPPETFIGRLLTSSIFHWNFASKRFAMNTECLATIYHPPTMVVLTAPHIQRVESRKIGPPAGLAIFGEEEEIEKLI